MSNLTNILFNVPGVMSVNSIKFKNISGIVNNRQYSDVRYDPVANTKAGLMFAPSGGIFEIRNPSVDITGQAA